MKKELPKVFINKIDKIKEINNNKEVFYSFKGEKQNDIGIVNKYDMQKKIDELFRSNDFIYKKKFHIKTKYDEKDHIIISKSYDYLLTIDGEKIYIDNIIDIY